MAVVMTKRSDLPTHTVLLVVEREGVNAWEFLSVGYPAKVILAAILREEGRDYLDYGVALHRPFLTPQGRAKLAELTASAPAYRAAERDDYPPNPCPICGDTDGDVVWYDVSTAGRADAWIPVMTRCTNLSCLTRPEGEAEAS